MYLRTEILCSTFLSIVFLLSSFVCNAQLNETFDDGDFSNNPSWTGDVTKFLISNGQLRSNAGVLASTSDYYLSTPSTLATAVQWEIFLNLKFATSGVNFADYFLITDNADLLSPSLNGYFVRIGDATDEVSLFKITNGTPVKLIDGADGVVNSSSDNPFKIRVTRDADNLWTLYVDDGATGTYATTGTATEAAYQNSVAVGIKIRQSSATSPANNHFFDDISVSELLPDTAPPEIVSATATSSAQLNVLFNEQLDATSAQTPTNYSVSNGVGQALSALLQPDNRTVLLTFGQNFPNATTSQLSVSGVKDVLNNIIDNETADFFFFQPVPAQYKDIIISEIFADPSPSVGLPEVEFIEIYNRSENAVDLLNWKITDGSSIGTLPTKLLMPDEYLILCATSSAASLSAYGETLGVPNFPTLNNSSDALVIRDNTNVDIDRVTYSDSWYRDEDKKQGGYTLELIDPENICSEEENWTASEAANGGTPGTQNSVFANKPDVTGPVLVSAIPVSTTEVSVVFNEKLDQGIPSAINFTITPAQEVIQAAYADASLKIILLTLSGPLQTGTNYTLSVENIYDCAGNLVQENFKQTTFGLPEEAAPGDIVINEILFNPKPFGVDFVELYNASSKYINLRNWSIGNYTEGSSTNNKLITTTNLLIPPKAFIAVSEDPATVVAHYPQASLTTVYKVADLPSFNDDEGSVTLVNDVGELLDFFEYSDKDHSVFIKEEEGVSLERINVSTTTNDKANWKSASATVGFATPGYANSNARTEVVGGRITISPEAFEPVNGIPAFTQIHYNFDQGGFVGNLKILDAQGRLVKTLANNTTLGTTGFFRWDGDTDDGAKARVGYYVVWLEVFNANGNVETFRKRVVIASRNR